MDFVAKIQSVPKVERWDQLWEKLRLAESQGGQAHVDEVVAGVAQIGRKWFEWLCDEFDKRAAETQHDPLTAVVRVALDRLRICQLVVREKETGSRVRDLEQLLGRLEILPKRPRHVLHIDFESPYAYVYGICAIAAWASKHASSVKYTSQFANVVQFLEKAGVGAALANPDSDPLAFDTNTILGFTRIDPSRRFDTDGHAGRLVRLFQNHAKIEDEVSRALAVCFAELIENVVKHAEIDSPAWLFANYHPGPRLMHVCICDRGIGVRETFARSGFPALLESAKRPTEWIRRASEPLVTSKTKDHAGYGLYIARELCRLNGGSFTIASDDAVYSIHRKTQDENSPVIEEERMLSCRWRGTIVTICLSLDQPLQLAPIYERLPPPTCDDETTDDVSLFDD